jgi:hypothetical protein
MEYRDAELRTCRPAVGIAVIALAFACFIGWHASKAHMSHRGIPVRKGQLRSFRGDRTRHVIWFLGMAAVLVVIFLLVSVH